MLNIKFGVFFYSRYLLSLKRKLYWTTITTNIGFLGRINRLSSIPPISSLNSWLWHLFYFVLGVHMHYQSPVLFTKKLITSGLSVASQHRFYQLIHLYDLYLKLNHIFSES